MTPAPPPSQSAACRIVLVDDDPVYREGLRLWLEQRTDFQVVAIASNGTEALRLLEERLAATTDDLPADLVDLVILSLDLGRQDANQMVGLRVCQQIHLRYPHLPILVLGEAIAPVLLAALQQAGASGFCPKDGAPPTLVGAIRQVAAGQDIWIGAVSNAQTPRVGVPTLPPLSYFRRNLRRRSLRQIEQALAQFSPYLEDPALSLLDRLALAGRVRELRAARWLVNRLLSTPQLPLDEGDPTGTGDRPPENRPTLPVGTVPSERLASPAAGRCIPPIAPLVRQESGGVARGDIDPTAVLFDEIFAKLQSSLENFTGKPLETDILRTDKKRELFYLILRKLEEQLNELRFAQIPPSQLAEKRSQLLGDLWQAATTDFLGKYYTVTLRSDEVEVVSTLLQEAEVIQTEILEPIPGFTDLLAHLLFQTPLAIDGVDYAAGNPEALLRAEALLSNLTIQVANAVVQPLLNRFADVEEIKNTFYDRRLLSSREIERFRNNLSWKYRIDRYFTDPRDIFESQYRLLIFYERGIKTLCIYAPRRNELEQLSGVQFAVTLALETRDAIAPRLRSAVAVIGSGFIYVLTEVIGRGIGLIGRGILKGIGNTLRP